ncbi:MAG TPA: hypothetical protein VEW69_03155 [Alphaproteobacteria bacterium]|nr:hypothetical protein [Alphaproteobacteria bacterium]
MPDETLNQNNPKRRGHHSIPQLVANVRNSEKSTGPTTPQGKAAVRFNAVRHGLTMTVLLSGESPTDFEVVLRGLWDHYQPATGHEEFLVERAAKYAWINMRADKIERRALDSPAWQDNFIKDGKGPDVISKVLRYDAHATRCYYKAIHELERVQAARKGQSVPLPVAVDVNGTESGS